LATPRDPIHVYRRLPLDLAVAYLVDTDRSSSYAESAAEAAATFFVVASTATGATSYFGDGDDRDPVDLIGLAEHPPHRDQITYASEILAQ
jgi:hypothetical protein